MFGVTIKRCVVAACLSSALVGGLSTASLVNAQTAPTPPATESAASGAEPYHHHGEAMFAVAAQAIGITPDQLRDELPGKSLAQVAEAHGKNPSDVALALKSKANARIDEAVADGRISADEAAQHKQMVDQRIDQGVTRVWPASGERDADR